MKTWKSWQSRTAAALVSLGVFVGAVVVAPTAAMAAAYVTCTPNTERSSGIVSPHPTYHDLYVGVTATGGDAGWKLKNIDTGAIIGQGWLNNTTTSQHFTYLFGGRYRLILKCLAGSAQGYLS